MLWTAPRLAGGEATANRGRTAKQETDKKLLDLIIEVLSWGLAIATAIATIMMQPEG